MKKKYAGYINLKPLNGVIYPSSIQNILMKNYIENNLKGHFYLSPTEILQAKFSITLNTLISNKTKVYGIVMLSCFLLPKNITERFSIYKSLLASKKKLYFIFDELKLENKKDIDEIENFIIFNSEYFVKTKKNLNKFENNFMKKYKNISFV
jgi:sporadic carbohydrate cluster protein (TIGR04323 family)